jgi:aryl-alcohol dehydrogenase-like predicted oxidoreductase
VQIVSSHIPNIYKSQIISQMAQLPQRILGRNGPPVSCLGFGKTFQLFLSKSKLKCLAGAMGLSSGYGTVDNNEERFKVLDKAVQLGSTFWDTSDVCE